MQEIIVTRSALEAMERFSQGSGNIFYYDPLPRGEGFVILVEEETLERLLEVQMEGETLSEAIIRLTGARRLN